jgi:hypothetical protein
MRVAMASKQPASAPGHSGGAVPDSHRCSLFARNEQALTPATRVVAAMYRGPQMCQADRSPRAGEKLCRSRKDAGPKYDGCKASRRTVYARETNGISYLMRSPKSCSEKYLGHTQAAFLWPPIAHSVPRGNHCARRATRGRQLPANASSHGMARQACRRKVRGSQASGRRSLKTKTEVDFRVFHKQRRCGSMKRMLFLGALVLGVTVCSQSFGFELLDRMLGHKGCASCCEPGCDAGNGCVEPGCGAGNGCAEPACGAGNGCAEPACDAGAGCCEPSCGAASCCGTRCRKKHDLFGGLKGLFEKCKRKHHGCCDSCCEPACDAGNGCAEPACGAGNGCAEPACGAGNGCAEPACDAGAGCCEPSCGAASCCGVRKKHCRGTPIADLLRAIHNAKKCRKASCCDSCCGEPDCSAGNGCCEPGCGAGNGCCEPACGAVAAPVEAAAPTPDASAAKKTTGKVVAVSRTVATK